MTYSITPKRLVYVDFARFKDTSVNSNMNDVSLRSCFPIDGQNPPKSGRSYLLKFAKPKVDGPLND